MIPWTVARQAPLSMGFSRQGYWSGLPVPPPSEFIALKGLGDVYHTKGLNHRCSLKPASLKIDPMVGMMGRVYIPRTSDAKNSASLYTNAGSNLGDRVLDEVEKDSFIALPGKGEYSRFMPPKPCISTWRR